VSAVIDIVRSRAAQSLAVILAVCVVGALHWDNDGLWYGDAPLHAANGLFWWDFLAAFPTDPIDFAVRYYARYPVIKPAGYPPLFYLLEGMAFAAVGPSPYVAKLLVLLFTALAAAYTMAWARRWIAAWAGWTGTLLVFAPGIVIWSNAVMLNVPATALGIASLYHFRRWLEERSTGQLALTTAFAAAVLLTYFPGGTVLCICLAWSAWGRHALGLHRRYVWIGAAVLVGVVPLALALLLGPVQAARNLPSPALVVNPRIWAFYADAAVQIAGGVLLAAGLAGAVAGLVDARWRREATFLALWLVVHVLTIAIVPARDPRYILLLVPALLLAAAIGVAVVAPHLASLPAVCQPIAVAVWLAAGAWTATHTHVPEVRGVREVAEHLRREAPHDAVLWDGTYGAVFAFYVRALDPAFERRVVAGSKLLYEYGPGATFEWTQTSFVDSTDDVVAMVRTRSGCRWVALTVEPRPTWLKGRRLLREAVERPEFELVRSFPTSAEGGREVRLYRVVAPVDAVATVDLRFPSFNNREFRQVVPITR
jgi:hypothetical protein